MSVFSETLRNFIKTRNVKVLPMAEYCGLDRSTLYKFINGKREPSSQELVEKMALFMKLTPAENGQLINAWQITQIGEENYYKRKSIEEFLSHFPASPAGAYVPRRENVPSDSGKTMDIGCTALPSPQQLNSCVHQLLLSEYRREKGRLSLFLQPEYSFFYDLLASLRSAGSMEIRHILCLDDKQRFTKDHMLYSIYCLQKIFPVCVNGTDYQLYYFYDRLHSHFGDMNLMPCMILASDAAIVCSSDFQSGILFHDPAVLKLLESRFQNFLEQCLPVFQSMPVTPDEYFGTMHSIYGNAGEATPLIAMEAQSCLQPFLTKEILLEQINRSLPGSDAILALADHAFSLNRQRLATGKLRSYFTWDGVRYFADTGRIREIPDIFYSPLLPAQRAEVLRKIADCCRDGNYRMLRKPLHHIPVNFQLCIWEPENGGIGYATDDGQFIILLIRERDLLNTFVDYLTHIDESMLYPTGEAAEMLLSITQNLLSHPDGQSGTEPHTIAP